MQKKILSLNDELVRNNDFIEKYSMLETQYNSDLKRLNFIVDGSVNFENIVETTCPFCDGAVEIKSRPDYVDASIFNYKKIKKQLKDLNSAKKALEDDIEVKKNEISELESKIEKNNSFINSTYSPEVSTLSNELTLYRTQLCKKQELEFLQNLCSQKTDFLNQQEQEKEINDKFSPLDYLDDFRAEFTEKVIENLKKTNYDVNSLFFDTKDFDFIINGKKKKENGKGYRAFFNSIISLSFVQFLNEFGSYKPNILILDSPILSLKLKDNEEKLNTSIKKGLFKLIINNSEEIQTIVFENKIPDIEYNNVNMIEFTLDEKNGRYGFLEDVKN